MSKNLSIFETLYLKDFNPKSKKNEISLRATVVFIPC